MKIKATDPEAKDIAAVLVDNKIVKFPIEADTDEGWCLANIPLPPAQIEEVESPDPDKDDPLETGDVQWVQVKLTGKVEIFLREKDPDKEGQERWILMS